MAGALTTLVDLIARQEPVLRFLVAGFALILTTIAVLAYRRTRHPRVKYVGLAYGTFLADGILLVWGLFEPAVERHVLLATIVLQFVILFLLYMAVLKRMAG